jgi:hypothetical protein
MNLKGIWGSGYGHDITDSTVEFDWRTGGKLQIFPVRIVKSP